MKMRIMLATEWLPPDIGGVARHVDDLAKKLSERGHKVAVITRKKRRINKHYEVYEIDKLNYLRIFSGIRTNFPIRRILKNFEPDIVHSHHAFTPIPLFALRAAKNLNLPTILTNHSAYFYEYNYILKTLGYIGFPFKTFIEKSDAIISVSKISANFIQQFAPRKRILIIPNGVDVNHFRPIHKKDDDSEFVILFVSRIVRRKGLHLLVESLRYLKKDIPNIKLVIVGEGTFEEYIRRRVYDLDLKKNVKFMGKIKDKELPAVYNNADLFVLPSLYGESFGIVVLEAMASGVPVIVSNIGGLKEIVNNLVDGILLEKNDPKEIYEKIMILYKNPDLRRYLSKNARRKVEEKYDWNKIICNIEKIYIEILEEKKYPLLYSKNM